MSDGSILVAILSATAAIAAAASATRRPYLCLGILFLLASVSGVTLETPIGTMRLEQPAIAAVALVLVATGRWQRLLRVNRAALVVAFAFTAYLVVLGMSSAFVAPEPVGSIRMVVWLAISMVGGLVALLLVWPDPDESVLPLAVGGAVKGAVGLGLAVLYLVAGPAFNVGIQQPDGILPRVDAFTWEANLYASFLAMCVPLTIEASRRRPRTTGILLLALVVIGLPLGSTRGAYLGFAAGLAVYALIRLVAEHRMADIPGLAATTLALFVVGLVASSVLLPNVVERVTGVDLFGAGLAPPNGGQGQGGPGDSSLPEVLPSLRPYPDTVSFRLERVPLALDDLRGSPIIGLGAESYGQRHGDPSQNGAPDHIAILAVAVLYNSGIVGALSLLVGFAGLLYLLWRHAMAAGRTGDWLRVGVTAAFAGSIVTILVAYQATNALHFSINWIVIGAASAIVARPTVPRAFQPLDTANR